MHKPKKEIKPGKEKREIADAHEKKEEIIELLNKNVNCIKPVKKSSEIK